MRLDWVIYLSSLLNAVAGLFVAVLIGATPLLRGIAAEKATGISVVAAGLLESVLSPWFWISFICAFSIFFATARLESRALRVFLFWVPSILICFVGFAMWGLLAYLARQAQHLAVALNDFVVQTLLR